MRIKKKKIRKNQKKKKFQKFKILLKDSLKNKIPENKINSLPSGFQKFGDIIIISLNRDLQKYSKIICQTILKIFNVKAVYIKTGRIKGEMRKPEVKLIVGNKSEAIHIENNCKYKIDLSRIMFSKGNINERHRLVKSLKQSKKQSETIVDMFAGIGYFSIPIAKEYKNYKIYAIDINQDSIHYLKENIRLNKIKNIIPILSDCRKFKLDNQSDRVIMGYLLKTYRFLPYAFRFLKSKGIIHYHDLFNKNELWDKPIQLLKKYAHESGYELKEILYKSIVKQFSPTKYHIVIDAKFKKIASINSD